MIFIFKDFMIHLIYYVFFQDLLGAQRSTAAAMRSEPINFPSEVDQLQFMCLQLREELIEEKAAKNHIEQTLKGEVAMLT